MESKYTTPGGYQRMLERLELARARYFEVCASNEEAAGAGDSSVWHDNFAYEENQRQMHQLAARVRELENLLSQVSIVPVGRTQTETVRIGSRVRLWFEDDNSEQILFIAGYEDGDPAQCRVSYNTPLARALLGQTEGDMAQVRIGSRRRCVEVLELLPPPRDEIGP